jgi:hypothetical protein
MSSFFFHVTKKKKKKKRNDNFLKVVTFPAALDKSTISIQVLPESVDANGDPHETMCLGIMITCLDINSPNSRNYKSMHYAPKKFVELEGGDEKNKYCVNHFPASKPAWIIEINFYKAAIGHAFLVQPTILSINELPLDLETGTYTDALKKMNDEKPFYFNYELMERTMRNDPLGGDHNSHGFRRLSFFVKSELVDELELDDGSESDFFSMDGSHFDFPNFA